MSYLTDYYKMKHLDSFKSATRLDCIASTKSYIPFETRAARCREKRFKLHLTGVPGSFSREAQRKAQMSINDAKNISSVLTPDLNHPLYGHGDVAGTNDALVFLIGADYQSMEIFVARGLKRHSGELCRRLINGELNAEIEQLRRQATPTNAEV